MKWRDVLVGSIATLIVTIVSGVAIFYLTRTPEPTPSEKLAYVIEHSASFESDKNNVALVNVILMNQGDAEAKEVIGSIEFPFGKIKDKKIEPSAGSVSGFTITDETETQIGFSVPCFLPKEKIAMSFLMESSSAPKPNITLKSTKSMATKTTFLESPAQDDTPLARRALSSLVPLLIGLLMTLFLAVFARHRLSRLSRASSLNNNGFVFLHKGLHDLASNLFTQAISKGEDSCHPIANYATCLALTGDTEKSHQYIEAAWFLARSPHEKAVVSFNRAIIDLLTEKPDESKKALEESLRLSRKEITFYCQNSSLLSDLIKDHPDIAELFNK